MMTRQPIAYLAPEIPALSATFVYNEIQRLEEMGHPVVPLSVHRPGSAAMEDALKGLADRTVYLYPIPPDRLLQDNLSMLLRRPSRYLRTLAMAVSDAWRIGFFNHVGMGLIYRFLASASVAGILLDRGCRHLHAHFAHVPTDIAMYAAGMSSLAFSFTAHANDIFERGWILDRKIRRAAFAVTISEYNRRYLAGIVGSDDKIHVIRCGVDPHAFSHPDRRPANPVPKIGTLGRLVEKKGIDDLIRACGLLRSHRVRFCLDIAGDGPLGDALKELAAASGIADAVRFLGPLAHDQVPQWLEGLDVFVLACRKDRNGDMDGIPVVLMEAMLSGVPVVSTRISGVPELVEDGVGGLLADAKDPVQLAGAIQRLLSSDALCSELREGAVAKVANEFEISTNVGRLAKLFDATHKR